MHCCTNICAQGPVNKISTLCTVLQVIEQINLPSQNRTNSFNYSSFLPDPTICTGTHSVGYSNISQQ